MSREVIGLCIFILFVLIVWYFHKGSPTPAESYVVAPDANDVMNLPPIPDDVPQSWNEVMKNTEIDPSLEASHARFVRDATRFSSGANFTNVADDNTNLAFVNFTGLRRPDHVRIGADARQIPDIDESVLQRNKPFRFN